MTIHQDMLDAAARGARELGDAMPLKSFVLNHLCADGGFCGRGKDSDLYYTLFALQALRALGQSVSHDTTQYLLRHSTDGAMVQMDLIHVCCLVGCWSCFGMDSLRDSARASLRERVLSFRCDDGGFAVHAGKEHGTAYGCFLALSALEDLGEAGVLPGGQTAGDLTRSVLRLHREGGGFANEDSLPMAMVPSTAACVVVLAHTADLSPRETSAGDIAGRRRRLMEEGVRWLLSQQREEDQGFPAVQGAGSDMLSTATALHAIAAASRVLGQRGGLVEEMHRVGARDYVLHQAGPANQPGQTLLVDCEYLFYGLLALGHLSE